MKDVFLLAECLAAGRGGIGRVGRLLAKVFAHEAKAGRAGVRALALNGPLPDDLEIPVREVGGSRLKFVAANWRAALAGNRFLYSFAGATRAHCRLSGLRRPYATFMYGIDFWEDARPEHLRNAREADLLLTISNYTRDRADQLHGGLGHATVCWLGTEEDTPPDPVATLSGPPTVLIVSRIDARENYKGHKELLDAWPAVRSKVPDARLVVVGAGSGLDNLKVAASHLPVGSVEFRGFVEEAAMERVWREASVFAMPSRGEGFGLVYIEAMRRRIPVIASVHDAGNEVNADGETGFNVNLNHPDELTDRLIHLLSDQDRAAMYGENGLSRWDQHFKFSAFQERFLNIFRPWLEAS